MDTKQVTKDTASFLISFLTYQAVRLVIAQLSETDPPVAYWLQNFSSTSRVQNAEVYLQDLFRERQELALRVLTVREHLAEEVVDFLPEMVRTGILQDNAKQRRQHLERLTGLDFSPQTDRPPEPQG